MESETMNVTRDVILDLLPLYLADEASPATRALVDAYLATDPELARRVREGSAVDWSSAGRSSPAPELELSALRRTRGQITLQRWLFSVGLSCTALAMSLRISSNGGGPTEVRLLVLDHPLLLGPLLLIGVGCLIAYFMNRWRLRDRF